MVLDQECLHKVEKKYLPEEDKKVEKSFLLNSVTSLKKRSEFLFIRKYGKSLQSKYFIINFFFKPNSGTRIGLTVSKKIGNAVKRNYLKRVIRSLLRENIEIIPKNILSEIIPKKKNRKSQLYWFKEWFYKSLQKFKILNILKK